MPESAGMPPVKLASALLASALLVPALLVPALGVLLVSCDDRALSR